MQKRKLAWETQEKEGVWYAACDSWDDLRLLLQNTCTEHSFFVLALIFFVSKDCWGALGKEGIAAESCFHAGPRSRLVGMSADSPNKRFFTKSKWQQPSQY